MRTTFRTLGKRRLAVSIPAAIARFVDRYRDGHGLKSTSVVIETALVLLRDRELERAYLEASRDVDPSWNVTLADGLDGNVRNRAGSS